jgi:Ca2+-binding RTX toxin-like protein
VEGAPYVLVDRRVDPMRANKFATGGAVMLLMTLGFIPVGAVSVAAVDASTCAGRSATIVGTATDDILVGTDSADVIVGLGGNDQIEPGLGDDVVCGGDGSDRIIDSDGLDRLNGGLGDDHLQDEGGSSVLIGKGGNDLFVFNSTGGEDTAFGGHGDDVLSMFEAECPDVLTFHGGLGRDRYFDDFGCGDVTFLGERGNDSTVSFGFHFGSVVLDGGDGDDVLRGGDEKTILRGGSGRDRLFGDLSPEGSSDRLRGGPGADSLHGMNGRDRLLGGTGIDDNFGGRGSDLCRSPTRGPRAHSCER